MTNDRERFEEIRYAPADAVAQHWYDAGYQAGRAAERAQIVAKLESEGVRDDLALTLQNQSYEGQHITIDSEQSEDYSATAITKLLEVIS